MLPPKVTLESLIFIGEFYVRAAHKCLGRSLIIHRMWINLNLSSSIQKENFSNLTFNSENCSLTWHSSMCHMIIPSPCWEVGFIKLDSQTQLSAKKSSVESRNHSVSVADLQPAKVNGDRKTSRISEHDQAQVRRGLEAQERGRAVTGSLMPSRTLCRT